MEHIKDLFGRTREVIGDKPLSERATLNSFFARELKREPRFVAIRMAHYKLDELYALQSAYNDRVTRNGRETADKWWWFITRTHLA